MDHGPPPPYTETDIYSNSGSASSNQSHPVLTARASNLDNASVSERPVSEYDAASSAGAPTIYTPPYTPDGDRSTHLDSAADGFDKVSSPTSAVIASASAYFESRPVHQLSADDLLVHRITVTEHTRPSDIPFPQPEKTWLERDVLPQDWETFINYLIPHHIDASNQDVAERKLKAELIDEKMHGLTLDNNDTSRTDLQQVDAQLEQLRLPRTEEGVHPDVNTVINQWQEGFFGPRGILLEVSEPQFEDDRRAMPGSWTDHTADDEANDHSQVPPHSSRRGFGRGWLQADRNGFRMGNLVADDNGFRIGNLLVADGQGFKFGNIHAGPHGFSIGGSHPPHVSHEHHRGYHPEHHRVHMPLDFRGRPSDRDFSSRMPQRDRSHSTSSSSSSGASSIESAGSLPDYDHLKDTQLPIAKQAIKDWLNNPQQPITKQTVKQIREEIKAAKGSKINLNETNRDALRKEVRDLFKEFKGAKKNQEKARKAAKRERKSLRREAKHTRKDARREVKQADRDMRQAEREAKKAAKEEVKAGKMPEVPGVDMVAVEGQCQNPPFFMPSIFPTHSVPQTGPQMDTQGWPFIENFQAGNAAKAAMLQAEGWRIEAEAKRQEALQKAEVTRQNSLDQANVACSRAEESRQEAGAKAAIAREKAQTAAALAREKAEKHRQRAEANARLARRKAEANRMLSNSNRMLSEVNRMRTQAERLQDTAKIKLLNVAEKLEEEAEKLKREGERLMAEAMQSAKDLENAF